MDNQAQPAGPFTRETLGALSKDQLIDLVLMLKQRISDWKRRLGMNSRNSSKPPSSDAPQVKRPEHKPTGRKPGGQPGHEGHSRVLLAQDQVDEIIVVKPKQCKHCGAGIDGDDPSPQRHQVWDVPAVQPTVTEYQLCTLPCAECGNPTAAELPDGVPAGAFGPRLQAITAIGTGVYRLSKRTSLDLVADLFHVPMGLGSVCACEAAVSEALEQPVAEAHEYVQDQPVLCADETGWRENRAKAWLWVAATSLVSIFKIHASRGRVAAKELLGRFCGVLSSDRWNAYNFFTGLRQLCWAHLVRDFTAYSEYEGLAGQIGKALLSKAEEMFRWWHLVRDGTWSRETFQQRMIWLRGEVEELLRQGTVCGYRKMQVQSKRILTLAWALWTFVDRPGVEPTNNAAERAVRPAVLWRKGSFGTHSADGSRFVERILTATATCKLQGRNVVDYITQACHAQLHGLPVPSLLPAAQTR